MAKGTARPGGGAADEDEGTAGEAAGASGAEAERARSAAGAGGAAGPVAAGGGVAKPLVKDGAEGPVARGTARPVAGAAVEDANTSEGPSTVRARYVAVLVAKGTSADNAAKDS